MLNKIGKELKTGVRVLWSQDRRRIKWGELDLDLSYIGKDIIAMALPGHGSLMATIRNSEEEYAAYLAQHHKGHYRIWNLSELNYDIGKFEVNSVVDAGWPDHHNPPLALAFIYLDRMLDYLLQDPDHVVVVHCVAGKGRTGCLIAMFMLYRNEFTEAKEALLQFARARIEDEGEPRTSALGDGRDIGGVRNPSQIRYVEYVAQLLHGNYQLPKHPVEICRIEIRNMPLLTDTATPYAFLSRYDSGKEERLFSSDSGTVVPGELNEGKEGKVIININRRLEQGDYVLRIKHGGLVGLLDTTIAWVGFHTAMLWPSPADRPTTWKLPKSQLDTAFKSKISLSDDFEISIIYRTDYTQTVPLVPWLPLLKKRREKFGLRSESKLADLPPPPPYSASPVSAAPFYVPVPPPTSAPFCFSPVSAPLSSPSSPVAIHAVPLEDFLSGAPPPSLPKPLPPYVPALPSPSPASYRPPNPVYLPSSEPRPPPSISGGVSGDQVWSCSRCTFTNSPFLPFCEMCSNARFPTVQG